MYHLTLPIRTVSEANTREHWAKKAKLKARWATLLALAGAIRAPKATGRRRMTVERHSPRALDADNLAGGCKEVVTDVIKDFGLLVDDSPKHAELVYVHVPTRGERPFTVVVLEDLP